MLISVRQLIELFTPMPCLGCGLEGRLLCASCSLAVTLPASACFACGRLTADGRACTKCRRNYSLDGAIVAAHYETAVRELILSLKFGRSQAAVKPAAHLIIRSLPEDLVSGLDGITCVPVSPSRRRERGYNQAELLARAVASELDLPFEATLRRRGAVHQVGAGRRDRFEQVKEAFEATTELQGHWLVIDDVMTTGATLDACGAALRSAGAARVSAAVVAGQRG